MGSFPAHRLIVTVVYSLDRLLAPILLLSCLEIQPQEFGYSQSQHLVELGLNSVCSPHGQHSSKRS